MKRTGLFFAVLLGAVSLGLFGTGVVRAEAHTDHCECGDSPTALTSSAHECDDPVHTWTAVTDPASLVSQAAVKNKELWLYIDSAATEFVVPSQVSVADGTTLHLCLNGHTVKASSGKRAFHIGDSANAVLTICDCSRTENSGIYAGSATVNGSNYGGNFYIGHLGTLRMYNTTVSGGRAGINGGNFYLINNDKPEEDRQPFQFFDCDILNGTVSSDSKSVTGGNINAGGLNLEFYNTDISGGTAEYTGTGTLSAQGGNLYLSGSMGGYLRVSDGSISGGTAKSGGNLFLYNKADCTLSGTASISGGTTTGSGGSVFLSTDVVITLSDKASISGGTASGGGGNAYLSTRASMILSGEASVFGGTAGSHGGNIYIYPSASLTMNGEAKIFNGESTGTLTHGGNVYIQNSSDDLNSGVFTMNGGEVYGGSCTGDGANVRVEGIFYLKGGTVKAPLTKNSIFINIQQKLTRPLHSYMEMSGGTVKDPLNGYANVVVNGGATSTVSYLNGVFRMTGGTLQVSEGLNGRNVVSMGALYISGNSRLLNQGTTTAPGANIYVYGTAALKPDRTDTTDTTKYHPVLEITGGTFESGTAAGAGSEDDPILGVKTQVYGGNIYISTKVKSKNTYTIKNATITGGTADATAHSNYSFAGGGNLYVGNAKAVVENCTITDGTVIVNGSTTRGFGGNIYVDTEGDLTLKNTTVTGGAIKKSAGSGTINGNGTNVGVKGIVRVQGTTDIRSPRPSDTGNNMATNADSARIYVSGGTVSYIQLVASKSELEIDGGAVPDGVGIYYGKLFVKSGRVGNVTLSNATSTLTASGGYFSGNVTLNKGSATFTGGFYKNDPEAATGFAAYGTIPEGTIVIPGTYQNPDTSDTTAYRYEVAAGYAVTATSVANPGNLPNVAAVSGGGLVRAASDPVLTASESPAYEFVKWQLPDGTESTANPLAVTAGGAYTAVYRYKSSSGFTLNVTDYEGNPFTAYTAETGSAASPYPAGSEITVSYTGEADGFNGWYNESGKLISREPVFTFNIMENTVLKASFETEEAVVLFYTANHQLFRTIAKESILGAADLPAVPSLRGKTAVSWNRTAEDIQASGESIIEVLPVYEDQAETYQVTVQYVNEAGETLADAETKDAVSISEVTEVTAPEITGYTFLYYTVGGDAVSYSVATNFRFDNDTTVKAVYGTAAVGSKISLTFITKSVSAQTVYLEALRSVPADFTLKAQGILFANDAVLAGTAKEDALVLNSGKCIHYQSSGLLPNDVTGLTLKNMTGSIYARAYVLYTDNATGEAGVVYTEIETLTP